MPDENLNYWAFCVSPHHLKGLLEWAFGTTRPLIDFTEIWNRRHGNLFKIKSGDTNQMTLHKISRVYLEWKELEIA